VTDLEHFFNGTGKHRTVVLPSELPGLAALVASFAPDGTVVGRKELLWFVVEALACGEQHESRSAVAVDEVRTEITTVMEGGEKAFLLRKEKYGF
jgi:hypothetical protein